MSLDFLKDYRIEKGDIPIRCPDCGELFNYRCQKGKTVTRRQTTCPNCKRKFYVDNQRVDK